MDQGERHVERQGETRLDVILGQTLKSLRQRADMTQADIAEFLEISPQQYQKYEKGASKCSLTTLYRLAQFYNVRPEDLLPKSRHDSDMAGGLGEAAVGFAGYGQLGPMDAHGAGGAANANMRNVPQGPLTEAAALAEILAIFIRIPNNETRRKILDLLGDVFKAG